MDDVRADEKRLVCLLVNKCHREYLEMVGFVCSQMSPEVMRPKILLLKGKRENWGIIGRQPVWDNRAGSGIDHY